MKVRQSPFTEATVTLQLPPALNERKLAKGEYVMASHNPIAHIVSLPCIHLLNVKEAEIIPVLTIESIHHALQNLDGYDPDSLDKMWEKFHGEYYNARKLLRC